MKKNKWSNLSQCKYSKKNLFASNSKKKMMRSKKNARSYFSKQTPSFGDQTQSDGI
jgi:hypothetical protein